MVMRENAGLLVDILTLLGAFFLGFVVGSAFGPLRRLINGLWHAPGQLTRGAKNVGERLRQAFKASVSEEPLDRTGATGRLAGAIFDVMTLRVRQAESNFREGMNAFEQGDYPLARRRFSQAIVWDGKQELRPLHVMAHLRLGWLDEERGAYADAREHYRQAVRLDAHDLDATVRLGMMHFQLGETGPAIFQFQRALELNPTDLDTHYHLYGIYRQAGMEREALEQLRIIKAGENAGTLADLFSVHGADNFRLGHFAEAVNDYELALQVAPARVSLYTSLGDLYYLQQQPRTALETWCRGLWIDYSEALAERLLPVASEVEDVWSVIHLVRDCAAHHACDGRYCLLLAYLLRLVGEQEKSQVCLEEAVRLTPQLLAAQEALGDLQAGGGQEAQASATYRTGLAAARAQESVYFCRSCAYVTQEEQARCFRCGRWGTLEKATRGEAEARGSAPRNLLERASAVRHNLSSLWSKIAGQLPAGD